ncbi:hypothetical protein SAMN05421771_1850 [Granulicella pectinivorans]|uniref:Uncharacterized protein n=1 Tax=Granulicella pectinivorans TaxID=474950 RepID=A0A1I6M507_9BACT|nr:hypothetical protein [Granulicella pectinivorans]SFS10805.1 hypothetical protein SAMN05421771_1850 [Granulicella pectinivorans]
MTDEIKKKKKYDKDLKRARERFHAEKVQAALKEAILGVSGTTVFDVQRIVGQLFERLQDHRYPKGVAYARLFQAEAVAWASRQAQLVVKLRQILSGRERDVLDTMLFLRLPEFAGCVNDADALQVWTQVIARRETEGIEALATWIKVHAAAVRSGIRRVLVDCRDLEGCIDDVEDQLFSEMWMYVADHAAKFADTEGLRAELHWRAYWRARAWKTERIRLLKKGDAPKPASTDGIEETESELAYLREQGKCSPRPIVLGPGDEHANDAYKEGLGDEGKVRMWSGAIDLEQYHNPIVIRDLPWTYADLERELRRAGPFRADEVYDAETCEQTLLAA